MDVFKNMLNEATEEIKKQTGRELDLENETYILQTKSAYLKLGIEENEEGEKELKVHVTGGQLTYLETDNDIFNALYGNENE